MVWPIAMGIFDKTVNTTATFYAMLCGMIVGLCCYFVISPFAAPVFPQSFRGSLPTGTKMRPDHSFRWKYLNDPAHLIGTNVSNALLSASAHGAAGLFAAAHFSERSCPIFCILKEICHDSYIHCVSRRFEVIIYGTIGLLGCTVVMLVTLFVREIRNKTLVNALFHSPEHVHVENAPGRGFTDLFHPYGGVACCQKPFTRWLMQSWRT